MYLIVPILYRFKGVFLNMYLINFTFEKNTPVLANMFAYTLLFTEFFPIEKVTPLFWRVVDPKQRKNGVFWVRPELNLALSDNPDLPVQVGGPPVVFLTEQPGQPDLWPAAAGQARLQVTLSSSTPILHCHLPLSSSTVFIHHNPLLPSSTVILHCHHPPSSSSSGSRGGRRSQTWRGRSSHWTATTRTSWRWPPPSPVPVLLYLYFRQMLKMSSLLLPHLLLHHLLLPHLLLPHLLLPHLTSPTRAMIKTPCLTFSQFSSFSAAASLHRYLFFVVLWILWPSAKKTLKTPFHADIVRFDLFRFFLTNLQTSAMQINPVLQGFE